MKCISKRNEKIVKNNIKNELKKLNYNFKSVGTKYMLDAIYLLDSLKMYYKFSLESDVYPVIANKYGDTAGTIKGAIYYATDKMFYDCDENVLKEYVDVDNLFDENEKQLKPGPKDIIRAILKKINDI